jgi:foldase protein PrsA
LKYFARLSWIIALVALSLVACSGGDSKASSGDTNSQSPNVQSEPIPALPVSETGDQIVATVNGQPITLTEFEREFSRKQLLTETASYDALADAVLSTRIEQVLIAQAAAEMDVAVSEEEIDAELVDFKSFVPDEQSWQSWLDENMYTAEEFRQTVRESLITGKMRDIITHVDDSTQVPEVLARHILVNSADEANNILTRLNNGEDFATLAAAYSTDVTTRESGGDLGWFIREDLLTPELADVAFQLEPGQTAGPVQTMLGFHIIQTLEVGQRSATSEEQPTIAESQFNNWLQTLVDSAVIERHIN